MGKHHQFSQPASTGGDSQNPSQENNAPAETPSVTETTTVSHGAAVIEAKAITPIDAAKLSEIAKAFQAKQAGAIQRTASGGIIGTFTIQPEMALVIESWAESAGEPLHSFCQQQIDEALVQFIEGQ
jgi:hypothetical protein